MHSRNWFWRYSVIWHTPSERACVYGPVHILFLDLKTYSVWPLNFSLRRTSFSIPSVPLQWLSWVLWLFAKDAQQHLTHIIPTISLPSWDIQQITWAQKMSQQHGLRPQKCHVHPAVFPAFLRHPSPIYVSHPTCTGSLLRITFLPISQRKWRHGKHSFNFVSTFNSNSWLLFWWQK